VFGHVHVQDKALQLDVAVVVWALVSVCCDVGQRRWLAVSMIRMPSSLLSAENIMMWVTDCFTAGWISIN